MQLLERGYIGKVGGDAGASFDAMNNGYIGAVIRRETPSPFGVSISAPGYDRAHGYVRKMTGAARDTQERSQRGDINGAQTVFDSEIHRRFMHTVRDYNLDIPLYERMLERYWGEIVDDASHEGIPERIQAKITTDALQVNGIRAEYVNPRHFVRQNQWGGIDLPRTEPLMRKYRRGRDGIVLVVPAHNGVNSSGHLLPLTPGCGDELATHMARAFEMPVVFFKRTQGIYSADPGIVGERNVKKHKRLSFGEVRAAALGRAIVVQDKAVRPLQQMEGGIISVRDFMKSNEEGTVITRNRNVNTPEIASIVSGGIGGQTVRVIRRGGSPEDTFGNRVTAAFDRHDIPIQHLVADGSGAIVFTSEKGFPKELKQQVTKEIGADSIELDDGMGLLCVTGLGLKRHRWEALERSGRVLRETGISSNRAEVNTTGHGVAMTFLVTPKDQAQFEEAIRQLHQAVVLRPAA